MSVFVCLSVKSHLTSGASVCPENAATDSAGNVGEKYCGVFSETASLQSCGTSCIVQLLCSGSFSHCYAHELALIQVVSVRQAQIVMHHFSLN